jgi:hypothetical protein
MAVRVYTKRRRIINVKIDTEGRKRMGLRVYTKRRRMD